MTNEYQPSYPNVRVEDGPEGKKWFRVIRPIRKNDEILLCYGPLYNRSLGDDMDYEINLHTKDGCGNPAEVKGFYSRDRQRNWKILDTALVQSEQDMTKLVDYLERIRNFEYRPGSFVTSDLTSDEEDSDEEDSDKDELEEEMSLSIEQKPIRKRARELMTPALPFKKQASWKEAEEEEEVSFSDIVIELFEPPSGKAPMTYPIAQMAPASVTPGKEEEESMSFDFPSLEEI
ncbi:unnamed protein product, partial [marine sediment metagenome]